MEGPSAHPEGPSFLEMLQPMTDQLGYTLLRKDPCCKMFNCGLGTNILLADLDMDMLRSVEWATWTILHESLIEGLKGSLDEDSHG